MPRTRSRISLQRRLGLLVGDGHHRPSLLDVVVLELLARRAEVGGQRDEALLGAVVQVALDAPALGLGAVDGRRAARLQPRDLGRVRPRSALGPSRARATPARSAGDADRDPRGDEHEPDDAGDAAQPRRRRRSVISKK